MTPPFSKTTSKAKRTSSQLGPFEIGEPSASLLRLAYDRQEGIDEYVRKIHSITPLEMIEIERTGVPGAFLTDLSKRMNIPSKRMYEVLRIPSATAARKSTHGAIVKGRAGLAAIGMIKLINVAQEIIDESTVKCAKEFDVVRWLGQWIEQPQPALGGRRAAEYLDTPTGSDLVCRVLRAIQSGVYL